MTLWRSFKNSLGGGVNGARGGWTDERRVDSLRLGGRGFLFGKEWELCWISGSANEIFLTIVLDLFVGEEGGNAFDIWESNVWRARTGEAVLSSAIYGRVVTLVGERQVGGGEMQLVGVDEPDNGGVGGGRYGGGGGGNDTRLNWLPEKSCSRGGGGGGRESRLKVLTNISAGGGGNISSSLTGVDASEDDDADPPLLPWCLLSVLELLPLSVASGEVADPPERRRLTEPVLSMLTIETVSPTSFNCLVMEVSGSFGLTDGLRLIVPVVGKSHSNPAGVLLPPPLPQHPLINE